MRDLFSRNAHAPTFFGATLTARVYFAPAEPGRPGR
jgi:hypothetical protein